MKNIEEVSKVMTSKDDISSGSYLFTLLQKTRAFSDYIEDSF